MVSLWVELYLTGVHVSMVSLWNELYSVHCDKGMYVHGFPVDWTVLISLLLRYVCMISLWSELYVVTVIKVYMCVVSLWNKLCLVYCD